MITRSVILITGGTGMIGEAISQSLIEKGHEVIILTRDPSTNKNPVEPGVSYAGWDIKEQKIDLDAVAKADYIIHLAGAGIADKRWTAERKKEIEESRVKSGEFLVHTLLNNPHKVKALVSASGIGWYGPDPEIPNPQPFIETDPPGEDFLGQTCKKWEDSVEGLEPVNVRVVKFRTGPVLSLASGMLPEFLRPIKFGIASILGNGKQVISWIHIEDLVRMYIYALENEKLHSVYNAVAPQTATNKTVVLQLAKTLKNTFFVPVYVPSFVLKAMLGELSIEVLKSTTVSPSRIKNAGFVFQFPTLEAALRNLIK
jgi:uncharacterized protein (TIGR01777 family)